MPRFGFRVGHDVDEQRVIWDPTAFTGSLEPFSTLVLAYSSALFAIRKQCKHRKTMTLSLCENAELMHFKSKCVRENVCVMENYNTVYNSLSVFRRSRKFSTGSACDI